MGRIVMLLFIVALVVGGWFGYQKYLAPPSPALLVYQQYAEALAREQYDKAEAIATGPVLLSTAALHQAAGGSTMQIYGQSLSMRPPSIREVAGEVFSIKWDKQSEEKAGDGNHITLVVTETV